MSEGFCVNDFVAEKLRRSVSVYVSKDLVVPDPERCKNSSTLDLVNKLANVSGYIDQDDVVCYTFHAFLATTVGAMCAIVADGFASSFCKPQVGYLLFALVWMLVTSSILLLFGCHSIHVSGASFSSDVSNLVLIIRRVLYVRKCCGTVDPSILAACLSGGYNAYMELASRMPACISAAKGIIAAKPGSVVTACSIDLDEECRQAMLNGAVDLSLLDIREGISNMGQEYVRTAWSGTTKSVILAMAQDGFQMDVLSGAMKIAKKNMRKKKEI